MDDLPRQKLRAILSAQGRAVCKDPELLGALLTKVCPDHPREVQALYHTLDSLMADGALDDLGERPWKSVAEPAVDELVANHSMTQEEAEWAATSWGVALGEISTDQGDSPVAPSPELPAALTFDGNRPAAGLPQPTSAYSLSPGGRAQGEGAIGGPSVASHRLGAPGSLRNLGVLAAVVIGGLVLSFALLPGLGGFKRGNLFLDQPASYWSQKPKEPTISREVWQGHVKIMKDVDPAADLRQAGAVPVLIDLLQDDSSLVRQKALLILSDIGGPAKSAIPAIQQAAKDPDSEVRASAVDALRKLDPTGAGE